MSTPSRPEPAPEDIPARKARHLEICLDEKTYEVEGSSTGLEHVHLIHRALPDIDYDSIDTSMEFLGYRVNLPFFIGSMTGGSAEGYRANKDLARVAQNKGIAVGTGSMRVLFRRPEVFEHFALKKIAPDVPVVANLGGVQVRDMVHSQIIEMLKRLEVDGLAIHLNPAQELVQEEGDRDFRGILDAIKRFCSSSRIPVIVKETGCGLHPSEVMQLLRAGAKYVNIAGSGGTNWAKVEDYRNAGPGQTELGKAFADWGNPTGLVLASLRRLEDEGRVGSKTLVAHLRKKDQEATLGQPKSGSFSQDRIRSLAKKPQSLPDRAPSPGVLEGAVLSSGGIRDGMDLAKSLVLGAAMGGAALPVIRAWAQDGIEGAGNYIDGIASVLKTAMALCDSPTLPLLRAAPYYLDDSFSHDVDAFLQSYR